MYGVWTWDRPAVLDNYANANAKQTVNLLGHHADKKIIIILILK